MDREKEQQHAKTEPDDTQPAEEWGERIEAGRDVAQGGRSDECVEGATDKNSDDPRADANCRKSEED